MGEMLSAVVRELSCHNCDRYVCNGATWHSRCCDQDECCECDVETRPVKPPEEELEIEMEVDNGCMDIEGLFCFLHASKK